MWLGVVNSGAGVGAEGGSGLRSRLGLRLGVGVGKACCRDSGRVPGRVPGRVLHPNPQATHTPMPTERGDHTRSGTFGFRLVLRAALQPPRVDRQGIHSPFITSHRTLWVSMILAGV